MAGIVGIDPGPLTLRELVWMADGRVRQSWVHTSSVLAMIANVNRDPKKTRAFRPDDFNPFAARSARGIPLTAGTIRAMKGMFKTGKRTPSKE